MVTPIFTGIVTTVAIYLGVVLFQQPIYRSLKLQKVQGYPVFCVAEPFGVDSTQCIDVYVVSLSSEEVDREELNSYISTHATRYAGTLGPDLKITSHLPHGVTFLSAYEDSVFNRGKGHLLVSSNSQSCFIGFDYLESGAVMRVIIRTSGHYEKERADRGWLMSHISLDYPGL